MDVVRIARAGDRLKATLSPHPWVLAILRNGSTVAGTDQMDSDVDFTVIVAHANDRPRVLGVLKRGFGYRYLGLDHGTLAFRDRRPIDITVIDRRTVENWLRRLYRSPEDLIELQHVVQHKLVDAVSVYDPQRLLAGYQRKTRAYPERIRKAVVSRAVKSLDAALEDWGSRNEFQFVFGLPPLLENICLALYARNRKLFMVPGKRLHEDLRRLRPNIEAEMHRLVRSGRSARSREEGRRSLARIIRKLRVGN